MKGGGETEITGLQATVRGLKAAALTISKIKYVLQTGLYGYVNITCRPSLLLLSRFFYE